MGKKSLSELADEQLEGASQEAFESKDSSGMYETFIKKDTTSVKMWKCENAEHTINIIPFKIGENFPNQHPYENRKPGEMTYYLDVWSHRNIGVNETTVLCLSKNWGKPCPMCEEVKRLRAEGGEENMAAAKLLQAKRRTVYNIIVMDSDEEERKGIQVWEVAHFFMQKHLAARAKNKKTGKFIKFASATKGKEVEFERVKNGENVEFLNHNFQERDGYIIEESTLEQAICLDEILTIFDYDTLHRMFWGEVKKDADEPDMSDPTDEEEDIPMDPGNEEEDVPKRERPSRAKVEDKVEDKVNKCPGKGVFGKDCDKLEHCPDCPETTWDECNIAKLEYVKNNPPTRGRARKA